ncbi:MAG TPA: PAS domain-containing sensor histidine kinase [Candidatus Acidoferrales bacterium]|jgi:PAS domain S-box-containing protein|nr:PAS domain-containing sensor histidine kinase [Bryobacteraceae bacterium]HWF40364.1 PAS domain-containing sensor histidine kinase [Candidatus Acidoferrales bacterium]
MSTFLRAPGAGRVACAALSIAAIAVVDWRVDAPIAFGFLYIFPLLLVGAILPRTVVITSAFLCTILADIFDPFVFSYTTALPQDILVFTALLGAGMYAFEATSRRAREMENLRRVEREVAARREAEEQLEFLIDSSPVAVFTMTVGGTIILANAAAQKLLATGAGELHGTNVRRFIPALGRVYNSGGEPGAFRTEMQCRGERANGDVFLANVFFSTYNTAAGPRLAALVVDASEEMRDREETSLQQLMAGSRILVGAVSHEVRNVCGAIGIIYENLARSGGLRDNKDFEALGSLVETLHKIASLELKQSKGWTEAAPVDLLESLNDLRIVLEPFCHDVGIQITWDIPPDLPTVWADPHSLLQVLLNLAKNSERALENATEKRISISAAVNHGVVSIRVTDTGPGIASVDKLFQPFQKGADSTGLGLYLSRAFVRSFHGDLRYDPVQAGCTFVIDLAVAGADSEPPASRGPRSHEHGTYPATVA